MLPSIIKFSLRFRGVVATLACLLLAYGIYVAAHARLDVFPDFVQPQVTVQTEAPGLSPEQVETLVTVPVESAVNGLGNMESLRSESIQGLSIITAVFREGTDVLIARQTLAEKMAETAGKLPLGVKAPRMTPLTSSTMDLLKIGLVSEKLSAMNLRTFADWTLKPKLLAVPGVAKCSVFGGEVRQLQVQVDPARLLVYDISLNDVLLAARSATGIRGAGFIETKNQRILIQTEGQSITAEQLGKVVVTGFTNGMNVRLRDVARVVEGAEPKFGDTLIQGKPGVLLTMSSQYGANTLEVTRALEEALREIKPVFAREGITLFDRLHRPATFIESGLGNIKHSLMLGGVLVAIVLFFFLGNVRTAFISLTAIPLSLLSAIILMDRFGISLNTITLGGLAIAIGEVVDDAIIDVENIFRRLRENQILAQPLPTFRVIFDASIEVRTAVVYATFIVVLVFVPVLTLTGLQGKFFAPLALSYILAILASLVVALTVTPALASFFFSRGVKGTDEPRWQRPLKPLYHRSLARITQAPALVVAALLVLFVIAALAFPAASGEFLPEFREGHFVLQVNASPGTSLPEMLRIGGEVSDALLKNPHIATVEQQVGRAELGEDPWGPHRSEFHVDLKPVTVEEEEKTAGEIRAVLKGIPGIEFEVLTFLGDRIGETLAGETSPVVINLFGDNLDALDGKAAEVAGVLKTVRGAEEVRMKSPPGSPRIQIRLRQDRLTQFGFRPVEVLEAIQTAYQGTVVAQTFEGSRVADVAVILNDAARLDPEAIGSLMLRNPQGGRLPLRELAEIYLGSGRHSVLHDGARRRQTITCNPGGRSVADFVREARKEIGAKVALPAGMYVEFSGAAEASAAARKQLLLHSAIAGVGILLLLSVVFGNWRNFFLVLLNLPFALVGGIFALWIAGVAGESHGLTIGSLVGFVTLFGITTRNSIMLISHYEHLVQVEGASWNLETTLRGASERLAPILMTALVTALGLLPLALGSGEAGREIEGPMAIVILGGLVTSTLLNLLVLPALALRYGHFPATAAAEM